MTGQEIKALIERQIETAENSARHYVGQAELFKSLLDAIEGQQTPPKTVTRKPRKQKKKLTLNSSPKMRAELAKDVSEIMRARSIGKHEAITVWCNRTNATLRTSTINTYLTPSVLGQKVYNRYFKGLVSKGPRKGVAVNS